MKSTMALQAPAHSAIWLVGLVLFAVVAFGLVGTALTNQGPADTGSVLVDANLAP